MLWVESRFFLSASSKYLIRMKFLMFFFPLRKNPFQIVSVFIKSLFLRHVPVLYKYPSRALTMQYKMESIFIDRILAPLSQTFTIFPFIQCNVRLQHPKNEFILLHLIDKQKKIYHAYTRQGSVSEFAQLKMNGGQKRNVNKTIEMAENTTTTTVFQIKIQ